MRRLKYTFALTLLGTLIPSIALAQRTGSISNATAGWLGIRCNVMVEVYNGSRTVTVGVGEVVTGSPAEQAGLKSGNRITRVDGKSITQPNCNALARGLQVGDTVRLHVQNGSSERDVTLIAAERPAQYHVLPIPPIGDMFVYSGDSIRSSALRLMESARFPLDSMFSDTFFLKSFPGLRVFGRMSADSVGGSPFFFMDTLPGRSSFRVLKPGAIQFDFPHLELLGQRSVAGAEFTEMNPGLSQYFDADEGLLVLRVGPGTPAARAGLDAGDVVTRVDGRTVNIVEDLRAAMQRIGDQPLKLEVLRKGKTRMLEIERRSTRREQP